jgi:hypothetical protein
MAVFTGFIDRSRISKKGQSWNFVVAWFVADPGKGSDARKTQDV